MVLSKLIWGSGLTQKWGWTPSSAKLRGSFRRIFMKRERGYERIVTETINLNKRKSTTWRDSIFCVINLTFHIKFHLFFSLVMASGWFFWIFGFSEEINEDGKRMLWKGGKRIINTVMFRPQIQLELRWGIQSSDPLIVGCCCTLQGLLVWSTCRIWFVLADPKSFGI